jgi:hypothetical protein
MERAVEIDRQDVAPSLQRVFPGFHVWPGDAGIVHENIDTFEIRERGLARAFDVTVIRDIDGNGGDAATGFELLRGLLRQREIAIPDRHRSAGVEKTLDDGAADSLRAAGDNRMTSAEIDRVGHCRNPPLAGRSPSDAVWSAPAITIYRD